MARKRRRRSIVMSPLLYLGICSDSLRLSKLAAQDVRVEEVRGSERDDCSEVSNVAIVSAGAEKQPASQRCSLPVLGGAARRSRSESARRNRMTEHAR